MSEESFRRMHHNGMTQQRTNRKTAPPLVAYRSSLSNDALKSPDVKLKKQTDPSNALAKDLLQFFQQQCEKDFKILSNGKEFNVNSTILSARSPVFHRMLQSECIEGRRRIVVIDDIDPEVIENFIDVVNTDSCSILRCDRTEWRKVLGLILIADRYNFTSLVSKCESQLSACLCIENVLEILNAAEQIHSNQLKKCCMERLQSIRGGDLLSVIRGEDIWSDIRSKKIIVEMSCPVRTGGTIANTGGVAAVQTPQVEIIRRQTELSCCDHDSIATVKRMIAKKWGVSAECQRLVFQGRAIDDERTLRECGVVTGSVLFLLDRSRRRRKQMLKGNKDDDIPRHVETVQTEAPDN